MNGSSAPLLSEASWSWITRSSIALPGSGKRWSMVSASMSSGCTLIPYRNRWLERPSPRIPLITTIERAGTQPIGDGCSGSRKISAQTSSHDTSWSLSWSQAAATGTSFGLYPRYSFNRPSLLSCAKPPRYKSVPSGV